MLAAKKAVLGSLVLLVTSTQDEGAGPSLAHTRNTSKGHWWLGLSLDGGIINLSESGTGVGWFLVDWWRL